MNGLARSRSPEDRSIECGVDYFGQLRRLVWKQEADEPPEC